ncbi:transglycosylase SLT domain-containing protein [Burkholderia cenocepacia]|uniref:lytic transglycosylase domain-containing protein n=1 Tax=Burkholderia cenocepacia TaxID=95486 RepID=UPI00222FB9A4|nr:transglycosylase SLT domain-containing protein [Burkholderia cenocepacia]MCW3521247.1 transglycosylase SLT domain-containing protein [Burkholderia cenocepacia]MCW3612360.1 transglycosylase SLT domain-containing protein [Burkholderia cenocepacia]MCW3650198.1 transglycosylase SLT domain-containing protein [Burkholderia cenocepacia]MCW3664265.1 transglycosylase SLT domain-containing protein [Burkholderia cenocepacia]MCW3679015.1 transglycosylase SLT domain-containing protein [Burkholderia ceno
MPVDSLYADQTASFLRGQNQIDVPEPPTYPSTSITSIARAVGRGLGQGGTALFGAASDLAAGLSQIYVDPDTLTLNPQAQADADKQVNAAIAKQRAGHLFESPLGTRAYDLSDTFKPDPTRTTAIDQTVQGVMSGLTQIVPAAVLGGPLAGAAVGGTSIGMSRAEDLKRQGVDVGTRTAAGAVEGAITAAGAVLPVAGSTLPRTIGLVVAGGPGAAIAQATIEKAILRNADYGHLADQINPLDPINLAAATLMAGTFAGVHVAVGRGMSNKDAMPATSTPLQSLSIDARRALPYNSPQLDAYAVQAAQAAGVPPELMLALKNAGEKSNSHQVSPKGAAGVSQMMPENRIKYGVTDPTDPVQALDGMAKYLADTQKQYGGNLQAMIADYNGGPKQAAAVLRGERPPAAETAAYLDRVNNDLATRGIDSATFRVTPEQVDAALLARGQRIVDDAYVFGRPDDVAAMSAHQDAFELAARQMDAGQFPDVARFVTGDDSARATALDSLIAETEAQRTDVAQQASGLADQGAVSQMRAELDQLTAARPDDSAAGVKELTRQLQDQGMKYKAAAAKAQKQINAAIADHEAQVQRLRGAIEENSRAQQAHQQLGALDAQLADLRTTRAGIDAPATRRTPLSRFVEDVVRAQTRREPVTYREPQEPILQAADTLPAGIAPRTAGSETLSGRAAPSARAIEANLRDTAALRPDMQVTIDTPAGERTGTVAELLQQIDDEHAMNTQDAGLFEVAANCFISLGG